MFREELFMRINTNVMALKTWAQYTKTNNRVARAVAKLSSGSAIVTAADNAAGLAISEKMRAQIRGLNASMGNVQSAISMLQVADGALGSMGDILQRMRELAVQSSSDTNNDSIDRQALQAEFKQLQSELDDIAGSTAFNKKNLLDGSLATSGTKLGSARLGGSGLTIQSGSARSGSYTFSVATRLEAAAVSGNKPGTPALVLGDAAGYFSGANTVVMGSNAAPTGLLNGNYTLSAVYTDPEDDHGDGQIVVTAKGDNGQRLEARVSRASLEALAGSTELKLNFNAGADDAFNITLNLDKSISSTESNFDTLAHEISRLSVSVSGGVSPRDAVYGMYANLTGAESVRLETGMSSVSFDNGVKVSFTPLAASALDSSNNAQAATAPGTPVSDAVTVWSNLSATDDSLLSSGSLTIRSSLSLGVAVFTAEDAMGRTYTAAASASSLVSADNGEVTKTTLSFWDNDGSGGFTIDYTTTATADGAMFTADAAGVSLNVTGAGHHYDSLFGSASFFGVKSQAQKGLVIQVGPNAGDTMEISIDPMDTRHLGVASTGVGTRSAASHAITSVDSAINRVSAQRSYLGAVENRLTYKLKNLETMSENLTTAESLIRDVDYAKEMTEFTKAEILQQAAIAMMAQANALPENILTLLRASMKRT